MTRPFPTKPARALPLAIACLAACISAAGCARGDGASSLEASIAAPDARPRTQLMALAPGRSPGRDPIATLPPEAGAVRDVRTRAYVDGYRQDVALAGSAHPTVHNGVTVLARTSAAPTLDERVPLTRPTEPGIRSEIGAQFPHLVMQVVERPSSNMYGPYGLALGRAGGDVRCLYAWQWIDANRMPAGAGVTGPLSLRVRLCQAGTSFDAMAALVDHLAIGAEPDARGPDERVAAGDPGMAAPDRATHGAPRHRAHPARARHRHASRLAHREEVAPTDAAPVETASVEPRTVEPRTVEPRTVEPRTVEPRTMASTLGAPTAPVAAQPAPTPFAADLPPQALLGPRAGVKTGSMKAGSIAAVTSY